MDRKFKPMRTENVCLHVADPYVTYCCFDTAYYKRKNFKLSLCFRAAHLIKESRTHSELQAC
jgi:hypothetical protein